MFERDSRIRTENLAFLSLPHSLMQSTYHSSSWAYHVAEIHDLVSDTASAQYSLVRIYADAHFARDCPPERGHRSFREKIGLMKEMMVLCKYHPHMCSLQRVSMDAVGTGTSS